MPLNPQLANSIATIKNYVQDPNNLYAVFRAGALTSDLETPMVTFIGARTMSYPVFPLATEDMSDYNPKTGFTRENATLERREATVSQDKGYQIGIDTLDLQDSGTTGVSFVNNKIRQTDIPTVDKYRLNKLYTGGQQVSTEQVTKDNALALYDAAKAHFINNEIPVDGTILYCTTTYYNALKDSSRVFRQVSASEGGNISRDVDYLDKQTKIVVVPETRWPATEAQFIMVNPKVVICGVKHVVSRFVEEPEDFDGILINRRLVHDLIIQEDRAKGVYVSKYSAD